MIRIRFYGCNLSSSARKNTPAIADTNNTSRSDSQASADYDRDGPRAAVYVDVSKKFIAADAHRVGKEDSKDTPSLHHLSHPTRKTYRAPCASTSCVITSIRNGNMRFALSQTPVQTLRLRSTSPNTQQGALASKRPAGKAAIAALRADGCRAQPATTREARPRSAQPGRSLRGGSLITVSRPAVR